MQKKTIEGRNVKPYQYNGRIFISHNFVESIIFIFICINRSFEILPVIRLGFRFTALHVIQKSFPLF